MTGSEKMAADFVAIVKHVLATVPPPRLDPAADVGAVAAKLVERIIAAYPPPHPGMTNMVITSAGEAIGFVEGSIEDIRRAATLLRAVTAAAQA